MNNRITSWLMSRFNVGKIDRLVSSTPILNIIYKLAVQQTINYDFPTHLFIEPTNACNFRCRMCPRTNQQLTIGQIDWQLFTKVIDEAKQYGPRNFCLHLFGEPLLDSRLIEMIAYIKNSNRANTILLTTNGSLLSSEKSLSLIDCGVDKISISLTSPDPKTFEKKTGVALLNLVEKNIEDLIKIKRDKSAKKPLIIVRLIVDEDSEKQIGHFKQRWHNRDIIVELREKHNYGGHIGLSHIKNNPQRYPCYHLWLSPAIHFDGTVSICCDDFNKQAVLGNIKEQSLHEIWTGPKVQSYRHQHLTDNYKNFQPCQNCDVWNIYSDIFFSWQKK